MIKKLKDKLRYTSPSILSYKEVLETKSFDKINDVSYIYNDVSYI